MATKTDIATDLTLELNGKNMTSRTFLVALKAFFEITQDISQTENQKGSIEWFVQVKEGSNLIGLYPSSTIPQAVVNAVYLKISQGVACMEKDDFQEVDFSESTLKNFKKLAIISEKNDANFQGSVKIWVNRSPFKLTHRTVACVNDILSVSYTDYGSITGTLDVISNRGALHANIYDDLRDKPIQCIVVEDMKAEILKYFGRRVEVYGLINYSQHGNPQKIKIETLEALPTSTELPSYKTLGGILKDYTHAH